MGGVLLLSVFALANCGRKGSPRPPEENAPSAVQYLSARGAVRTVSLSWQAPLATASGGQLKDIASFVIQRRDVVGEETNNFEDVGVLSLEPETKLKDRRFTFEDPSVVPGRKYDYIVFGRQGDGLNGETNKIIRVSFRGETSTVETIEPETATR